MVPFIGLTGGIGVGKSEALAALGRLGAAVLSTDAVVHQLYESDEVRDEVAARFGPDVVKDGVVDRSAVAQHAFASAEDREWLESILWPRVGARMSEWRLEMGARTPPPPATVVEVPLLFESGMDAVFDATIAVLAPEQLRTQRAGARGHAALQERGARQLAPDEKAARATYVVDNDGTIEELEQKLSAILDKLQG